MSLWKFVLAVVGVHLFATCTAEQSAQVLIIGGGPAAIFAANALNDQGVSDFLILEEGDVLNGYYEPIEFGGLNVIPGSPWAYNANKFLFDDTNTPIVETNYSSFTAYDSDGNDVTELVRERENVFYEAFDRGLEQVVDDIERGARPDLSEKATAARGGWIASTNVDKLVEWYNEDFDEGHPPEEISTIMRHRQQQILTNEYFILGDAAAINAGEIAKIDPAKIVYNARAVHVSQDDDHVTVTTEDGSVYTGDYALVTSTVGVIQHGGLTFDPPLPPWKAEEYMRYQMCIFDVVMVKFPYKFWDDTEYIMRACTRRGYYPVFLNMEAEGFHPAGTNILMAFITGDEAYRVEQLSDEEAQAEVVQVLELMYGKGNVPEPTEFYLSRFGSDPDLYGVFTTWPINGNVPKDSQERISAPFGRLYLAPEEAADDFIGIAFGSVNDGIKSATALAACILHGDCPQYSPRELAVKPDPNRPENSAKVQSFDA